MIIHKVKAYFALRSTWHVMKIVYIGGLGMM